MTKVVEKCDEVTKVVENGKFGNRFEGSAGIVDAQTATLMALMAKDKYSILMYIIQCDGKAV